MYVNACMIPLDRKCFVVLSFYENFAFVYKVIVTVFFKD